jgi:protein SCO1/2
MKRLLPLFIIITLIGVLAIGAYQSFTSKKPPIVLDTLGMNFYDTILPNGEKKTIKIPHKVMDFSFINQNADTFTQAQVEDKIYVADFFFTTCPSICPIMGKNLKKLSDKFINDDEVHFLSYTVDPEEDTPDVLKAYAQAIGANEAIWTFLTGNKKDLYHVAREGYKVTAMEGDGGEEDFIHTQNFVLIDKARQIRGYYDGTDSLEMRKLEKDILLLKKQYAYLSTK